jgi:hypothetical protein
MRTSVGAFALVLFATLANGTSYAADCTLFADKPEYNGAIYGSGSWANCPLDARITVLLRKDRRWWPDLTLDSKSGTGSSGTLTPLRACGNGFDPWKVYIETRLNDKKTQSQRAVLPCEDPE